MIMTIKKAGEKMRTLPLAFAIALSIIFATPLAAKPRSIIGTWSAPGGSCRSADGLTMIGQMSLKNDDVTCKFRTVKRKGQSVTWQGPCDDAEGSSEQTVTASEKNGVLKIRYSPGGNVVENMVRCGR
jgi:hypothetical protein